ncbi:Zinc finger, C2H2 type [Popillia japonica]|uniref:Zinc finger, C2H2 type n=1 Tax=Popillia japonica TaxID=7064 RepID=A0AAW1KJS8_POPJA
MTDNLEIICRTCLEPTKESYNIFTHTSNNNLISFLIMDCTPMRVSVNDGFPPNACTNCIAKLNFIYDFKTTVMKSDRKLRQFYTNDISKTKEDCGDQRTDTSSMLKSELNELESAKGNSDVNENESVLCDPLVLNDLSTQEDDIYMECNSDDKLIEFEPIMKEEPLIQPEMNLENACETSEVRLESTFEELNKDREISTGGVKIMKRVLFTNNVNKQQVELLNNADYNRIMSMGLTKEERNRMTIFCPDCNKSFAFGYFVGVHAHLHTGNLLFKCEKCDKRFPKQSTLNSHMRCHAESKDFQCEECSKSFKTLNTLRVHKTSKTLNTLRVHKTSHTNERSYKCNLCTKAFKNSIGLQMHTRRHLKQKTHVCEICGQSYTNSSDLYSHHIHNHSTDRSNRTASCKTCGKIYTDRSSLLSHIRRQHEGKRPHVCEQCGKSFFQAMVLKQHMLIHTGEKPYACRLCGKKFRQKGCVTQHMPYACRLCGKKFRQKGCVTQHMRIHTGETPHPCKFCTAAFKHSHHLRGHIKAHHKDEVEK